MFRYAALAPGKAPRLERVLVFLVAALLAACPKRSDNLAFVLTNASDSQQDISAYLANSKLDGIALQESWSDWEPSEGSYSWEQSGNGLDKALSAAKKAGKRVTLHMIGWSSAAPGWLADDGAQYYYDSGQAFNVPWDSVYLGKYTTFINALASHLSSSGYGSTVFDVSLVVPVSEMTVMGCSDGVLGTTSAGGGTGVSYDGTSYYNAWQQMGTALQQAFPASKFPNVHYFVSPPAGEMLCAPAQDESFYPDLLGDLLDVSADFWMFAADLDGGSGAGSKRTSPYTSAFASRTGIGYQMICSSTSGSNCPAMSGTYPGNLQQAVCAGLASGGQYFEIYKADVLNSNQTIQDAIQVVHYPSLCP